jgi:large subunit ribosomal protein L9|tara:strand:+ start:514 stop:969 length:456 start_codon:yes stop_codon:yes gene_type:complete
MKVVFLEDVPKIAKAGEIKEVADGYGRNFLIPKKLAALVAPGVTNRLEAQRHAQSKKQAQMAAELAQTAKELDGKEVILKAKAGDKDRLYGRVTSADIAAELERTIGIVVDKRKIEMDEPIRQLGSYEALIKLGTDVMSKIKVTVTEKGVD